MGIHGLFRLLSEEAPESIKETEFENYTGRKIAIDASMAMYQFLIAVRSSGPGGNAAATNLTNEAGEVTSHIQGMFNRTIKMMSCGIKPCYVFDGKPPQMKGGELEKRMAKRAKAEADLAAATAADNVEEIDKHSSRLVKVSRQHNEDCKELLRLMGVPVIDAPCEAEAQCAELAKKGKVFATGTEDMDALTFATPKLLRKLTFSQNSKDKQCIQELDFDKVLTGLDISYEQFVDLCILCGCDYCGSIRGIGPKTALKLIKEHKCIEAIIKHLEKTKKHEIPGDWYEARIPKQKEDTEENTETEGSSSSSTSSEEKADEKADEKAENGEVQGEGKEAEKFKESTQTEEVSEQMMEQKPETDEAEPESEANEGKVESSSEALVELADEDCVIVPPMYVQARALFHKCDVTDGNDLELKWNDPDEKALTTFLVDRMQFNPERVSNSIKRLKEAQKQKSQQRMDSFFKSSGTSSSTFKRPVDPKAKGKDAKKGKFAGKGKKR